MTHDEAALLGAQAHERELEAHERRRLDAHLRDCASCRAEHAALGWLVRDLTRPAPDLDEAQVQRVVAAVSTTAPTPKGDASGYSGEGVAQPHAAPASPARSYGRVAAGFAAGLLVGYGYAVALVSSAPEGAADVQTPFVLLLEEPTTNWPPDPQGTRSGYTEWAQQLVSQERFAGGRRLDDSEGWHVAADGTAQPAHALPARQVNYSGWVLVYADDYAQAIELARRSPHLSWGGILVRRSFAPPR